MSRSKREGCNKFDNVTAHDLVTRSRRRNIISSVDVNDQERECDRETIEEVEEEADEFENS